ncbi:MAG TPA: methyltransferase [Beijerinckiaceae bacterium]|jgi:tRNA1(Val) A37 N6-methylase TrmN6
MPEPGAAQDVTEDTLAGGRIRLRQPRRGHRAGTDAVLLAASVAPLDGEAVYDLGAGAGAVGLMIASRARAEVALVEREPWLAALCRENAALNGLEARVRVVEADLLAGAAERRGRGLLPQSADVVATNPPFLEAGRARRSPTRLRASAHELPEGGLERWIAAAADLLKAGGRLALIHRADALGACLRHLAPGAFGGVAVRPVQPRSDEPAIRILVSATKGSRAPLRLLPALVLHDATGAFTPEAEAVHRGERLLVP